MKSFKQHYQDVKFSKEIAERDSIKSRVLSNLRSSRPDVSHGVASRWVDHMYSQHGVRLKELAPEHVGKEYDSSMTKGMHMSTPGSREHSAAMWIKHGDSHWSQYIKSGS